MIMAIKMKIITRFSIMIVVMGVLVTITLIIMQPW